MSASAITGNHATWRLLFVAGPQRGRAVQLQRGENWIGSSPECAIVVASDDIAAKQILLSVGDIAVSIRNAGDAEVRLNGAPLDRQRRSISPGDIVTLAKVKFEIDRVLPGELHSGPGTSERAADYAWQKAMTPATGTSTARAVWGRLRTSWGAWAVLAGLCLVSVGVFPGVVDGDSPADDMRARDERTVALQRTLAPYPNVAVRDDKAGQLAVAGYVINAEERRRVQELVRQSSLPASFDVHVASDVLNRARQFFSGTALSVDYDEARNIVISGTVGQAALAQRIKNFIADMHGTVSVVDKVQYKLERPIASSPRTPLPTVVGVFVERAGGTRWIQTADGARYQEGSQLNGGLQVVRITLDQVDFKRDGEQFSWRVGQRDIR
jgi:hypothetical protein